jgi:steroid 5-alpha reductase family enzyme
MKLTLRDGIATLLVAAILVPYVGFLVNGEMPFIKDPRGMAATGLVLGVVAFLVGSRFSMAGTLDKVEFGLAMVSLALGVVALIAAETAAAEALLAAFIATVVVVWAIEMLDHAGLIHIGSAPTAGARR